MKKMNKYMTQRKGLGLWCCLEIFVIIPYHNKHNTEEEVGPAVIFNDHLVNLFALVDGLRELLV